MKLSLAILASVPLACAAFAPTVQRAPSSVSLAAVNGESTRAAFLTQSAGLLGGLAFLPGAANAAKYGDFGRGSPEVLNPKDAIIDDEILASDAVQKSIQSVKSFRDVVKGLRESILSDSQAELGGTIRRELDFVKLRSDLNTVGTAFDEETQRGTDRLVRLVLQDITELETASKIKPGVPRSDKRKAIVVSKLDKLCKSFDEFLAFSQ
mmetsp:Transcript_46989/g.69594  ORF Transcript_46989/g.69594 Transcript_46989/m.69594 type:complete len:209 (+) Transcript_46989:75-701(+)|eukprot:CAMPEP_0195514802 /NCGR_PEP_ID=MMETSP0794_2-20130614/6082_1 /TAXON_ID=515487 /ORGANISM="Stephanopyxis turris, Strain CCMP 815" /LENGTH=208 /DNA_ID=CAMNT_0040643121 /DNA_START=75 /DNA_END=701 /DNA_ORIENTATION=-